MAAELLELPEAPPVPPSGIGNDDDDDDDEVNYEGGSNGGGSGSSGSGFQAGSVATAAMHEKADIGIGEPMHGARPDLIEYPQWNINIGVSLKLGTTFAIVMMAAVAVVLLKHRAQGHMHGHVIFEKE